MKTQKQLSQDSRKNNILAARIIAETVRSTLGPKGMDKVLVDQQGNITITNDGATILSEMAVEHPIARMIVEIAQTQELEVGDGTTSAVILAGELLKNADTLLEKKIHPTVISQGFSLALAHCLKIIHSYTTTIKPSQKDILQKIAETAMTGKSASSAKTLLAKLCVDAVLHVAKQKNPNVEDIQIILQSSKDVQASSVEYGVVIDKGPVNGQVQTISNAKIALLSSPLELRQPDTKTQIQIRDPSQIQSFLQQEETLIQQMIQELADNGVTAVFTTKGIDELAQQYLHQHGIVGYRRVRMSDIQKLASTTNAKILNSIHDLKPEYLGDAKQIRSMYVQNEIYTFIQDTPVSANATILLYASTKHVVEELRRAVEDALGDLCAVIRAKEVVSGAGSIEMALSRELHQFAQKQNGREQLAVQAFANALEVIPLTIAENSGLDQIDILTKLISEHEQKHFTMGVDVQNGVSDAQKQGIIEPLLVKTQALIGACEVANLILRIDDVLYCGPVTEDDLAQAKKQLEQQ